eukprot:scaffold6754_cov148-Amphora_coffeaeformis.AAC.10
MSSWGSRWVELAFTSVYDDESIIGHTAAYRLDSTVLLFAFSPIIALGFVLMSAFETKEEEDL